MTYGTGGRVEVRKCNDQHMGYGSVVNLARSCRQCA